MLNRFNLSSWLLGEWPALSSLHTRQPSCGLPGLGSARSSFAALPPSPSHCTGAARHTEWIQSTGYAVEKTGTSGMTEVLQWLTALLVCTYNIYFCSKPGQLPLLARRICPGFTLLSAVPGSVAWPAGHGGRGKGLPQPGLRTLLLGTVSRRCQVRASYQKRITHLCHCGWLVHLLHFTEKW